MHNRNGKHIILDFKSDILTYKLITNKHIPKAKIIAKMFFNVKYDLSKFVSSTSLFDDFFNQLIDGGHHYKDLLIMTNYIVSRIKERNFKDIQ